MGPLSIPKREHGPDLTPPNPSPEVGATIYFSLEIGGHSLRGWACKRLPIPPVPTDEFRQIVEAGANILTAIHSL